MSKETKNKCLVSKFQGLARSMPTSGALDRVAEKLNLPFFEVRQPLNEILVSIKGETIECRIGFCIDRDAFLLTIFYLGFRSLLVGNFLGISWMPENCQFVVKKVLELVLITFVRRMAYGKCLRCIQ